MEIRIKPQLDEYPRQFSGRTQQGNECKCQRNAGEVGRHTAEGHQARAHELRQTTPDGGISQQKTKNPTTHRGNEADLDADPVSPQDIVIAEQVENVF